MQYREEIIRGVEPEDLRVMEGERDCGPERRSSERCGACGACGAGGAGGA